MQAEAIGGGDGDADAEEAGAGASSCARCGLAAAKASAVDERGGCGDAPREEEGGEDEERVGAACYRGRGGGGAPASGWTLDREERGFERCRRSIRLSPRTFAKAFSPLYTEKILFSIRSSSVL